MTPYFMAVLKGMFKVADALVKSGFCDQTRINPEGKNVKDIAWSSEMKEACDYLGINLSLKFKKE